MPRALYNAVADSREELLKENLILSQEAAKDKDEEDPRLHKVQGELLVKKGQMQVLAEGFSQIGGELHKLEDEVIKLQKESHVNVGTSAFEPYAGIRKDSKTDPEGYYRDERVIIAKLAPFRGDPKERRAFLNAFLLRAGRCSDEQKRYWFRQLAGHSCFSWFDSGRCDSWEEMKSAFLAIFTDLYKKGESLKQPDSPTQGAQETVVQYRTRFESYLPYFNVARDLDDVI